MRHSRSWILALAVLAGATAVFAQGNPTGTLSGHVTDPDNLALPGVTVSVASPVLQGVRTAVTSANGDYIIPFLPAGEYAVTFQLQGFATLKQTVSLKMADTLPVNGKLTVVPAENSIRFRFSVIEHMALPSGRASAASGEPRTSRPSSS
jgi:Ca-activated chloride channel family protein